MFDKQKKVFCSKCKKEISILFIKCGECSSIELCLQCFALGIEIHGHLNSHKYLIVDNGTFPLFDLNWTAEEESALIDSVEQYGLGNWEEVAVNVPSKTAREVEEHYLTIYVDGYLGKVTAPASVPNRITDHTPPIYETSFSIPLPPVRVSKQQQLEIAYMPNRDDFEYEFDNEAETVISSLFMTPDDGELDKGLKLAKVGIYHAKLMERQRRKGISREYHLVEKFFRKDSKYLNQSRYEKEVRMKLRCCSQFMKYEQFEKLAKGLVKEKELKRKITKLKNYRKNGLTKFEGCNAFDTAVYCREKKTESKIIDDSKTQPESDSDNKVVDLKSFPEYGLLGNGERNLCFNLKMTPGRYLTAKVLIVKDAVSKQHAVQGKARYSSMVDKTQRRRILSYMKDNGWV